MDDQQEVKWYATRVALKQFARAISCTRCQGPPYNATRLACKHLYCKACVWDTSACFECGTPTMPTDMLSDLLVTNLVHSCNAIAEAIKERDLWYQPKASPDKPKAIERRRCSTPLKIVQKDIDKPNPKGETRLHTACAKGQHEFVVALLAAGASPNTKDNAGWTPLQEAVNFGFLDVCQSLLEFGAQPNVPGLENRTPLHEAACCDRPAEARLLLRYNANKNVFDQFGNKPIDYARSEEMREILMEDPEEQSGCEKVHGLNCTLDRSLTFSQTKIVVFPSNLTEENQKLLSRMAAKHSIEIATTFRSSVTHTIVEANSQNVTNLSYDVMMTILSGAWMLSSEWISLSVDLEDISDMDLELFEVSGAPCLGTPRKARENAQNMNPRLFNKCFFYFCLQPNATYRVGDVDLTRESLAKLVTMGDGTVLTREPDPEDLGKNGARLVPFHTGHDAAHPLRNCTHYTIYVPGTDEPRIKYNMPHIKALPLMWLVECIEKFTLVDPAHLGLV